MTSSRPYLIRALYQWIVDNGVTPYILVDALIEGIDVPAQYIQDNKIVLNIAPMAVHGLTLGDEVITFNARFGGKSTDIFVPTEAVLAIYARENGQGMMFSEEPQGPEPPDKGKGPSDGHDSPAKPTLRVVK
ncbi:MAG: ClpXP protease specificity-enhancing factor [Gammaproteobacteria bacterium]|nr:ClpXP protease specificity-enhancing factor [Gammaproteobacteria bacterium]MDH5736084.1 ClpXP protease specificity-enhancing factor [Gammaproteobacteria bacterium]